MVPKQPSDILNYRNFCINPHPKRRNALLLHTFFYRKCFNIVAYGEIYNYFLIPDHLAEHVPKSPVRELYEELKKTNIFS